MVVHWLVVVIGCVSCRVRIGILSQPSTYPSLSGDEYEYIQSSYVQDLENSGAQVVPVLYTWPPQQILQTMQSLQGMLLPGGRTPLKLSPLSSNGTKKKGRQNVQMSPYALVGELIIKQAQLLNRQGTAFILWGTCLGFEQLLVHFGGKGASGLQVLHRLQGTQNYMSTITLHPHNHSTLFSYMPSNLYKQMSTLPLFYFNHKFGILEKTFRKNTQISEHFIPLATNKDMLGRNYVVMAEGIHFPFYGVQFHPEKISYDWSDDLDIRRQSGSIDGQHFLMNFFVNQVRKRHFNLQQPPLSHSLFTQAQVKHFGMDVYFFKSHNNHHSTHYYSFLDHYKIHALLILNLLVLFYAFYIQNKQLSFLQKKQFFHAKEQ